jgi:hypothetical protein
MKKKTQQQIKNNLNHNLRPNQKNNNKWSKTISMINNNNSSVIKIRKLKEGT